MSEAIGYIISFLAGMYVMRRFSSIRSENRTHSNSPNWETRSVARTSGGTGPYEVGDSVWIKEAWGDWHGRRHDERATIASINSEGELGLEWSYIPHAEVRAYLEDTTFTVEDIAGRA